jgi:diguanylate cyclase (GGDEF)-like protein
MKAILLGVEIVVQKLLDKLQERTPVLRVKLFKLVYSIFIALIVALIVQRIQQISETLNQTWSINIFYFFLIILFVAGLSSVLTYIYLKKEIISLKSSVYTDELTGWNTKKILRTTLEQEIEHFKTKKKPLSIIKIDIDDFSRINKYGHNKADLVLKEFATTVKSEGRNSADVFIRCYIHGDEFLIIATGTDIYGAKAFAERLRNVIKDHQFQISGTYELLTISIGVTELNNEDKTIDDLLDRVDEALNEAKIEKNHTSMKLK